MSILVDKQIRALSTVESSWKALGLDGPLLEPFSEAVSGNNIVSYGLTSAGYDLRLGNKLMIFKNSYGEAINPKRFKDPLYMEKMFDVYHGGEGQGVTIPANAYVLGVSREYIRMPRLVDGTCYGKSTYARSGIIVNLTPIEPEWEGYLTIEISNSSPCPAMIFVGEGIAQLKFHLLGDEPEISYKDKNGKYNYQKSVTPPIVI